MDCCVVQRVYINPDAVDDALVDLIHTPSGQLVGLCILYMYSLHYLFT